jgi:hypothetical protein
MESSVTVTSRRTCRGGNNDDESWDVLRWIDQEDCSKNRSIRRKTPALVSEESTRDTTGLFGRAPATPKTAPALAPLVEWLLWWSWVILKIVWQNSSSGGFLVGARWSHQNVAPPPLWKPRGAPAPAPHLEPVQFTLFGRAPDGAARGAGAGALPNRLYLITDFVVWICSVVLDSLQHSQNI